MKTFTLKIANPEKVFFEGEVQSLSSKSAVGPFDVLPEHAHFVALLHNTTITVRLAEGADQDFQIFRGLIEVQNNMAKVFVDL